MSNHAVRGTTVDPILSDLVRQHATLRAALNRIEDAKKPINAQLRMVEAQMHRYMEQTGAEKAITEHGSITIYEKTTCRVHDSAAFLLWVLDDPDNRLHYLNVKANATKDDRPEGASGVTLDQFSRVRVTAKRGFADAFFEEREGEGDDE